MSPARSRGAPRSSASKSSSSRRRSGHLEHRPDQHPDHVSHERVGLDPELQHAARKPLGGGIGAPLGAQHPPLEAHVLGLGRREGREVVLADDQRRAAFEPGGIQRVRPPKRPAELERVSHRCGMDPVAVGARAGVAPGVEAVRGLGRRDHRDLARQQRVDARREPRRQRRFELEARHLPPGVDAGVGSAGDGEPRRLPQDPLERRLELGLNGSLAGLRGPAGERRAVVGDGQPVAAQLASRHPRARPETTPGERCARRARGRPSRSSPSGAGRA